MQHEGFREEAGFFISHKTHSAVGGGEIINTLARQMQSNKNLGLDGSFSVAMNVFKDGARRKLVGRGVEKKKKGTRSAEKMRETILLHHFGEKRKRVLGNSHCMVKALCLGKLVSDSSNPRAREVERKKFKKTLYSHPGLPFIQSDTLLPRSSRGDSRYLPYNLAPPNEIEREYLEMNN